MTYYKRRQWERNCQRELPLMSKGEIKKKIGEKYKKHEDGEIDCQKKVYC
jgi:hypothetical protein